MRTTITLDPDVDARIRRMMQDRQISFREAINSTLRSGLRPVEATAGFQTPTHDFGAARVNLDRALELSGMLEDDELLRKTGAGGSLVNDAHLAAIASEYRATIITFDNDFSRFAGVRWQLPAVH